MRIVEKLKRRNMIICFIIALFWSFFLSFCTVFAETYQDREIVEIKAGEKKQIVLEEMELKSSEEERGVFLQFMTDSPSIVSFSMKSNTGSFRLVGYDDIYKELLSLGEYYETEKTGTFHAPKGINKILICEKTVGGAFWWGYGYDLEVSITITPIKEQGSDNNVVEDEKENDGKESSIDTEDGTSSNSKKEISARKLSKKTCNIEVYKTVNLKKYIEGDKNNITWSSSNERIAKVSKKGKVKGLYLGTVKIVAKFTDTNQKLSWKINVNKETTTEIRVGDKTKLKYWTKYVGKKAKWKSSKKNIIKITNGKLVAKKTGIVTVACKYRGVLFKLIIKVKKMVKKLTRKQKKMMMAASVIAIQRKWPSDVRFISAEFIGNKFYTTFMAPNVYGVYESHQLVTYRKKGKIKFQLIY